MTPLTPPRRARAALGLLLASAVLTAAAAPSVADGSTTTDAKRGGRYVALGDSAAAGPVLVPQQADSPGTCYRSEVNFPSLTAARVKATRFKDATCSGATTADLYRSQDDGVPPQLDALTRSTRLVTLGPIGANDVGLVSFAAECVFFPGCAERDAGAKHDEIRALAPELVRALAAVQRRAPNAQVVVVGYGQYLPPGACPDTQPISAEDGDYVQGLVDHLDRVLRKTTRGNPVRFADLRATPGALEHTACAPAGERWVEGLTPESGDGAAQLHPTAIGMKALAGQVVRTFRGR